MGEPDLRNGATIRVGVGVGDDSWSVLRATPQSLSEPRVPPLSATSRSDREAVRR